MVVDAAPPAADRASPLLALDEMDVDGHRHNHKDDAQTVSEAISGAMRHPEHDDASLWNRRVEKGPAVFPRSCCEMGTVPAGPFSGRTTLPRKGRATFLRSRRGARPSPFRSPAPAPSRLQVFDLDVRDRDFIAAFAFCSSPAHLQLIYGSSPAHLSFTPLW